jgi:hypothetical protein
MSATAASGSGEPPEGRDYGGEETLPRSGLLEQAHAAERATASLRAAVARPLSAGVGRHEWSALRCPQMHNVRKRTKSRTGEYRQLG